MNRKLKSCVHPDGYFLVGIHKPSYTVLNNRISDAIMSLGILDNGESVRNLINFPTGDLNIKNAQPIFEISNAFPFWGTTYILADVAKKNAETKETFSFIPKGETSFDTWDEFDALDIRKIPRPIILTIAQTCTNPEILSKLLVLCAHFERDSSGNVKGLKYERNKYGYIRPKIIDHDLYETLGNNPFLPDNLKRLLLLNPGVQGASPIVGEYIKKDKCHIWEYLRANSYIPWGHYAANMAQDSIRYLVKQLDFDDIRGLRHLYYQRIYVQLAHVLNINFKKKGLYLEEELEELRCKIIETLSQRASKLPFTATLWGWNYGYDFSGSGFRLHASHQQIHQQFALIPEYVTDTQKESSILPSYAVGDLVASFVKDYNTTFDTSFFNAMIKAILNNKRIDGNEKLDRELVIFKDENVMLFVPKAQRSQGELQIVCLKNIGNIIEADSQIRKSLDMAILFAVKALTGLGARMITCIEVSKRFNQNIDQRLFYCFLPKHPQSPGAFSEQQGRWITGHFPEDFARACRETITSIS